jgi:hypothetical protein
MASSIRGQTGAVVDLTAAALHSLASGSFATLAEYDNGAAGNLYLTADFEVLIDTAANLTAGAEVKMWFLLAIDGTNYLATNGPPPNLFAGNFIVQAAQDLRYGLTNVRLPLCKFKPYIQNSTGQTTGASGNHLKMLPNRFQAV